MKPRRYHPADSHTDPAAFARRMKARARLERMKARQQTSNVQELPQRRSQR